MLPTNTGSWLAASAVSQSINSDDFVVRIVDRKDSQSDGSPREKIPWAWASAQKQVEEKSSRSQYVTACRQAG
eukprot:scaffold2976_cov153-Skeletonema_dohrnii-CCMP3373.AAC.12